MAWKEQIAQSIGVSLVVPAFNEEERISRTLTRIIEYFKEQTYAWELIIVDDGSRDQTSAMVYSAISKARDTVTILRNDFNRGKGFAVKRGIMAAKGEYVFFTDADMSTPIEEINKSLPRLEKVDVVVGSRALGDSNILIHQPLRREMMGRFFNRAVRLAAVGGIYDTQCGFKGFRKKAARETFALQSIDGFGFDVEILYIAKKLGYKIEEIPITWSNSVSTRVSPVRDGLGMLGDLARVRINDIRGLYGRARSRRQED